MLVCFAFASSVINLIYLKQLVLLYYYPIHVALHKEAKKTTATASIAGILSAGYITKLCKCKRRFNRMMSSAVISRY